MADDTAGDPMGSVKWTRKSTYTISHELHKRKIPASPNTTGKLLKRLGYSLKANRKAIAETRHPDRNRQFEVIALMKSRFEALGQPIISVDSKKKELVGNFSHPGRTWRIEPEKVYNHDFRSTAIGIANPYGIFEPMTNMGTVVVGVSYDTPEFAVESIILWLKRSGLKRYPRMNELLIFCDAGGSNSCRARAWKYAIYKKICKAFGITVTVCHFPTGASKWNPVDHRLFSFISQNWAGVPLRSFETVLKYIRSTTTNQGLKVKAILNEKTYEKGVKISDSQLHEIKIERHDVLPQWNYIISP
jgi:hypothetical protein